MAKNLGYNKGRSFLGTVPFLANQRQELAIQNGIPKDYYLLALLLTLKFRYVVSGGTTDGVLAAEFGHNLLETVEISGNHKALGDFTVLKLPGASLKQLSNVMDGYVHRFNGTPLPAVGTYDIQLSIPIHFPPQRLPHEEQLFFLLDCPNWTTLQLYINWGNANNLVIGGDRTTVLHSYGVNTGDPTLEVSRIFGKFGSNRNKLTTIPMRRSYKSVPLETTIAAQLITDLIKGNFVSRFWLKTGTRATGISIAHQGDNFATLSDALITRFQLKRDDIPQRDINWLDNQDHEGKVKTLPFSFPSGYNLIDFCEDESILTAYDTRSLALNNLRLELWGDVAGSTDQRLHVITEELFSVPVVGRV